MPDGLPTNAHRAAPIAIAGMALSLPKHTRSSADIAARAGLRLDYVEDFLGIRRVFVPSPGDHPCAMGVRAARIALHRARIAAEQIDLILYVGSDYKEHVSWTAALKLQKDLGARSAVAFDVTQTCTGLMTGLCVASAMMRADPRMRIALLAGGQRTIDHVDYTNPLTHFLLNTSAGGGAMVLRRGDDGIARVLETHLITDGSACEDVLVYAGGSKHPLILDERDHALGFMALRDPKSVSQAVALSLIANTATCVRQAIKKSGRLMEDLRFLAGHHGRIDHQLQLLEALELSRDQTVSLEDFGHLGPFDVVCSLEMGAREGRLRSGDLAVCAGAGIGFTWAATALEWRAATYP
jgi:3-oxoacyl-[acyl-carrier-protein] synthase-3